MKNLLKKHASQRRGLVTQKKREFDVIERRFVNVWQEMEAKFRKDLAELDKHDAVRKMNIKE